MRFVSKGFTFLELLIVTPFVLWFLLAVGTAGEYFMAQGITAAAARDAARTVGVYHNQALGTQNAVNDITKVLPANWRSPVGGAGQPHCSFDPVNPNPSKPDVVIVDDGTFVTATVTYNVVTMSPGLPKLLNSSLSPLNPYIPAVGVATFKHES